MLILGLNAYHGDSSACLLEDGKLIAAVEEERFLRVKHWAGFPLEAIRWCLKEAKASLSDLEHVAINSDPKAQFLQKMGYTFKQRPDVKLILDRIRNRQERAGVEQELTESFSGQLFSGQIHRIEHHLAHLASAHWASPFNNSVVISVDGFGDFSSAAWGIGQGGQLFLDERILFPHSLGVFYQAFTQYLGFPNYGDEYKVMGLAPYGKTTYLEALRDVVSLEEEGGFSLNLNYFRHHNEKVFYEWNGREPSVGNLFKTESLQELTGFGPRNREDPLEQHHKDLAHSVQAMYEEAFFHLLKHCHQEYHEECLSLAGGCAMNSVANGKVYLRSPFNKVYVQAAAGDAGGAIGAAMVVWNEISKERPSPMHHAYLGPKFGDGEIKELLHEHQSTLEEKHCSVRFIEDDQELCDFTAKQIAEGFVVGWFQGCMEWGPRALGNRSILCDPRRKDMKDILNHKIKRRESFRPFAPSILREAVAEWFELDDDVPFMMQVFPIRKDKRSQIPAVTHVDGSGRLQTVHQETNPRYYQLIRSFEELTNVPLVLNTSFNENEPIVCQPMEALDCFLRTKMDVLVMGNHMIQRPNG